MIQPGEHKNFIFSQGIDAEYLYSLYENDYPYIEEVYSITLSQFDDDFNKFRDAWAAGSIADLKKAAHKMKPAMGFAGLTDIQQLCLEFEELCGKSGSIEQVKEAYQQLITTLASGKVLISDEYQRLKAYNATTPCP